jgi:hypothetical protein
MSFEPGEMPGTLAMHTDSFGSERSWIRFLPKDKMKQEGDDIHYTDSVLIVIRGGFQDNNLHLTQSGSVVAYHKKDDWYFNLYERYEKESISSRFLRYGIPVVIRHKELSLRLAARHRIDRADREVTELASLIRHLSATPNPQNEEIQETAYLTYSKHEFHFYWILERAGNEALNGGIVRADDKLYLRCATSGKYLSRDLSLVDTPEESDVFFIQNIHFAKSNREVKASRMENTEYDSDEDDLKKEEAAKKPPVQLQFEMTIRHGEV